MSQESFPRPSFLNKKLSTEGIDYTGNGKENEREVKSGFSTKVCQLEEVSPETAKQVPNGFVLKQHRLPKDSMFWNYIFSDEQHNTTIKDRPLSEIASKLQNNYRKINLAFSEKMPDLILPTEFIVGEDEHGEQHIYELQPKVNIIDPGWEDEPEFVKYIIHGKLPRKKEGVFSKAKEYMPDSIKQLMTSWENQIKTLHPESQAKLKKELNEFVALARTMPDKLGFIPYDLAWFPNVALTKDGLRIIDINTTRDKNSTIELGQYNRMLDTWQMLADAL